MTSKSSVRRSTNRGFALILVLFVVALILVASLALMANAQYGSLNTQSMQQKNAVYNAAESGVEDGLNALDGSSTATGGSGSLANGYSFNYTITSNVTGALPKNASDGVNSISIPPGFALIVSTGSIGNQRPTVAEAIVRTSGFNYTLNNVAIAASGNLTGNWNHNIGLAGSDGSQSGGADDANVYVNGTINASVGFIDGWAKSATGTNSLIGQAGVGSATNAPALALPTSTDFTNFVAQQRAAVGSGNGSTMIDTSAFPSTTTYSCPTSPVPNGGAGCVMFIDVASVSNTQSVPVFNGPWTVVVNGSYSSTGHGGVVFNDPSPAGAWKSSLFAVNGTADIGGNATAAALIWTKADLTLHGNGNEFGAVIAGGNVNLLGGGSGGGFQYDKNLNGYQISLSGHYAITAYGEY
jgi:hypothetical protein